MLKASVPGYTRMTKAQEDKRKLAEYSSIGLMFPAATAIGLAAGYFLDRLFNTSPYLLIIFTLYGIAAGFVNLVKMTKKKEKND
jgi:ATP synthase protein I